MMQGYSSRSWSQVPTAVFVMVALLVPLTVSCASRSSQGFVRGVVVRVEPDRVEVRHKTGQRVIVATGPTTTVERDQTAAPSLQLGQRVDVDFDRGAAVPLAKRIRIWSGPAQ